MKAVAISILLLVAVVICSIANAAFVNARILQMSGLAMEIFENSSGRAERLERLSADWDKNQPIFRLSTSLREVDRVSENLLTLQLACQSENEWAIRQSCVLFCDALDDIARYETFNIFKII